MLETIIVAALTALGKLLLDYIQRQQVTKQSIEMGRTDKGAEINKETADAERRAGTAAARAPDVGGVIDDMESGKF
jgi:hypothetical protein